MLDEVLNGSVDAAITGGQQERPPLPVPVGTHQ